MNNPSINDQSKLIQEGLGVVFENKKIAILIETIERTVVYANQSFCDLFEIKSSPYSLINTNVVDNARGFSLKFKETERFFKSITNLSHQPNSWDVWELRNGKRIAKSFYPFEKNNQLQGYIWQYKQVDNVENSKTKPNKNDKEVSPNESPFEAIVNSLPHPIALYNIDKKIVSVNLAYVSSPQKRNWIIGKSLDDWYSYENKNLNEAYNRIKQINKTIEKQKPTQIEETFLNDKLNRQTYIWHYVPIFNKQQQLSFVVEHAIDISTQKSAEEKLKQSTQHLFNVLQHCSDYIIHTNDDLQIKFINQSFTDYLQQKKPTLLTDTFALKQYELYKKVFTVLLGETKDYQGKISLPTQDGKEKLFKYNLLPNFTVEDGNKGILITLNDITTKETEEAQLLALVKREKELNELKTAFVNMVSHELRTPLTVISSSAEILDLLIDANKSKEELQVHTKQIIDEVDKMTAFMQDLLMVSKIEAGKVELNISAVNATNLIKRITQQQFAPYKDGRTCEVFVKNQEKNIHIDANMISHVLQNILSNAFKYSENKEAPYIRISYSKLCCYISIVDNGIGIPAAEIKSLFTSFFRATNTGNISGTGIGLMVVKYFTQQHKGDVFVRSKQNKGTIFTIKLPY